MGTPLRAAAAALVVLLAVTLASAGTPAETARALRDAGKPEEAEKVLVEALAAAPADGAARLLLGEIQAWDGRPDEAMATWTGALAGKPADAPLLVAAGYLHIQRMKDGPWSTRRRGNVEMKAEALTGGDPAVAEAFKKEHLAGAEDCFRKAAAAAPADAAATVALAEYLLFVDKGADALPLLAGLAKKEPKNPKYLVGWAAALQATGKPADAKGKLDQALKLAPRSGEVHAALFRWIKANGKEEEAKVQYGKAQLYGWLPDFSKLDYSEDLLSRVRTLAVDPFWNSGSKEEAERMWAEKRAIVDGLIAKKDEPSWDLLACICWNHCCHGPIEEAAFAALAARGKSAVPLLRRMLDEGGSTCTIGAAARALAGMKEASAFEAVAKRLEGDVDGNFPMDIAGALRTWGDPRAVPFLVAAMGADAPPLPPPPKRSRGRTVVIGGPAGAGDEVPDGGLWARARAVMALGEFDGKEARAALEKGAAHPDIGAYCHAVLWRLTGDEKAHGRFVAVAVRADGGVGPMVIGPYLERIDHPNAKMLFAEWKAKVEARAKGE